MYSEDQVFKVLSSAGIDVVHNGPNDFIVFCPFHNNKRTPAGEVNHESGVFYCFSCKRVATLQDFVCRATGLSYFQVERLIAKHELSGSIVDQVNAILDQNKLRAELDRETSERIGSMVKTMHGYALDSSRAKRYLESRSIHESSIEMFNIGYSPKQDMITFPFMSPDGSRFIGFEGRSIEGKRFQSEGKKSETLFNLNRRIWSSFVYLTESVIDCMRLEQLGFPAVSSMGSSRGKTQVDLLKRYFNTVLVIQDNDDANNGFAGQASALKLVDKLGERGIIVKPPKQYKDIGDMPDTEIRELVASTGKV